MRRTRIITNQIGQLVGFQSGGVTFGLEDKNLNPVSSTLNGIVHIPSGTLTYMFNVLLVLL